MLRQAQHDKEKNNKNKNQKQHREKNNNPRKTKFKIISLIKQLNKMGHKDRLVRQEGGDNVTRRELNEVLRCNVCRDVIRYDFRGNAQCSCTGLPEVRQQHYPRKGVLSPPPKADCEND